MLAAVGALAFVNLARVPELGPSPPWVGLPRPAVTLAGWTPGRHRQSSRGSALAPVLGPSGPRIAWALRTGSRITAQPVIGPAGSVYVTSHDGRLRALRSDGSLLFARELGGRAFGGALVDAVGNSFAGSDAEALWSFDARGAARFRVELGAPVQSAPVSDASGALVLCAAGRVLFALRADDGAVAWRFATDGRILGSPAVGARGIYFGAQDHKLYALTPEGRLRWAFDTGADIDASPVVGPDEAIYVGADDRALYAFEPDGRLRFRRELSSPQRAPAALAGDLVVLEHGLRPALHAIDPLSGKTTGRFALGLLDSAERSGRAGPLVDADGVVYLGTLDHRVLALGKEPAPLWSLEIDGVLEASPALSPDGTLYLATSDGVLLALR